MRIGIITLFTCLFTICLTPTISNVMGSLPVQAPTLAPRENMQDITVLKGKVQPGASISQILDPVLPLKTVYELNRRSKTTFFLRNIRPGQPYLIHVKAGRMVRFEYRISRQEQLVIQKKGDQYTITREPLAFTIVPETVTGHITSSLFEAIRTAKEGCNLALKLADIFAWDIDFLRDIRPGDRFRLIVEKRFYQGKFAGYGHILAAEFTNQGKTCKAFFHQNAEQGQGYYDAQGHALQKAFLKAPLSFSRISSGFSMHRMHPILKEIHPHPAVDYAAPEGTPVKTVGDGVVADMGYSNTMGNHVMIRHAAGYVTRYWHLSRFARGLSKNQQVSQGQLIGFVGQTGYATGPHLDFRITKDGRPVNPLTYKTPTARPVPSEEMPLFLSRITRLSRALSDDPALAMGQTH